MYRKIMNGFFLVIIGSLFFVAQRCGPEPSNLASLNKISFTLGDGMYTFDIRGNKIGYKKEGEGRIDKELDFNVISANGKVEFDGKSYTYEGRRADASTYVLALALPFGETVPKMLTIDELELDDNAVSSVNQGSVLSREESDTFEFTITSEDGSVTTKYQLNITVEPNPDVAVTGLVIMVGASDYTVSFVGGQATVTLTQGVAVPQKAIIKSITTVGTASISENDEIDIASGRFMFTVAAQSGSLQETYTVLVREAGGNGAGEPPVDGLAFKSYSSQSFSSSSSDVYLGIAILDPLLRDNSIPILDVRGLASGEYQVMLDNHVGDMITVSDGKFSVLISHLPSPDVLKSITDGAEMKLGDQKVAVYKKYEIRSWYDLQGMRQDLKGKFTLINDIVLPEEGTHGMPQEGFEPIGRDRLPNTPSDFTGEQTTPTFEGVIGADGTPRVTLDQSEDLEGVFSGTFNGNSKTISNLYINRPGEDFVGLFGQIAGDHSSVINLNIVIKSIEGRAAVGGLSGKIRSNGDQQPKDDDAIARIVSVSVTAMPSGEQSPRIIVHSRIGGGIVGLIGSPNTEEIGSRAIIELCYATIDVEGQASAVQVGGIAGTVFNGRISQCYAIGSVSAPGGSVGGLVGEALLGNISNCYATGSVTGGGSALVDQIGGSFSVETCYAIGDVIGSAPSSYFGTSARPAAESGDGGYFNVYAPSDKYTPGAQLSVATALNITASTTDAFSSWSTDVWDINLGTWPILKKLVDIGPNRQSIQGGSGGSTGMEHGDAVTFMSYSSAIASEDPDNVFLGIAILDPLLRDNNIPILDVHGLDPGEYQVMLGDQLGGKVTFTEDVLNALVTVSDLPSPDVLKSIADGAEMKLGDQKVAVYKKYEIRSWYDLQGMRQDLKGEFTLINDIVLPEEGTHGMPQEGFEPIGRDRLLNTPSDFTGEQTTPTFEGVIGNDGTPRVTFDPSEDLEGVFSGTFNGNSKTISNLYINRPAEDFVGLFGQIAGDHSSVINLNIVIKSIEGRAAVGGLSGKIRSNGDYQPKNDDAIARIERVSVTAMPSGEQSPRIIVHSRIGGGIVGLIGSPNTDEIGSRAIIELCYATIDVEGQASAVQVGGIAGTVFNGRISQCYATGSVSAPGGSVGGLVGEALLGNISNCYATGSVTGGGSALVDQIRGSLSVETCYAIGDVIGSATSSYFGTSASPAAESGDGGYFNVYAPSDKYTPGAPLSVATGVTISQQMDLFTGWSADIWEFTAGNWPTLKGLATVRSITN